MQDRYAALQPTLDALAEKFDMTGYYAVSEDGRLLAETIRGRADGTGRPVTANSRYLASLLSPWVLGLCALYLTDQKKLRLSDRLARFFPAYPHAARITVRDLLRGRSGIPDYLSAVVRVRLEADAAYMALSPAERYRRDLQDAACPPDADTLIAMISSLPLTAQPDTESDGGNPSERVLMGAILEQASGLRLYDLAASAVFVPAGMDVTEGDQADTDTAGFLEPGGEVPVARTRTAQVYTVDAPSVRRLTEHLAAGGVLSPAGWRTALLYTDAEEGALVFEMSNGQLCFYGTAPFGYEVCAYFTQSSRVCCVNLLSHKQHILRVDGDFLGLRPAIRHEIEGMLQKYTAPRAVRVTRGNVYHAMELKVTPAQEDFVEEAKSALAYAGVCPHELSYVIEDAGRTVGLLILSADRKKDEYAIEIVLIDRRYQGLGYGRFMLTFAVAELIRRGATTLEIGVHRQNKVARHLYESLGFVADQVYDNGVLLKLQVENNGAAKTDGGREQGEK